MGGSVAGPPDCSRRAGGVPPGGGPGDGEIPQPTLYAFLETQRIDLSGRTELNPGGFPGGWIDIRFPGTGVGQAFVGVLHEGPGISVGRSGSPLDAPYRCTPVLPGPSRTPALPRTPLDCRRSCSTR